MARLKIEEIVLICVSLFFLTALFFLGFFNNNPTFIFEKGWATINSSAKIWIWGASLSAAFLLFRIYLFLIKINSHGGFDLNFYVGKLKYCLKCIFIPLKTSLLISITGATGIMAIGIIQQITRDKLMNLQLLDADKILTGGRTPLLWFHSSANPLIDVFHVLSPAIIFSFMFLGTALWGIAIFLYFDKNKKLFKGFLMSIFIVFALATPLWYFFPANSPANVLLHGPDPVLNYDQGEAVKIFQEEIWESEKDNLPISTMPSMHWAWSIIIVYYLFKKERKTIFPALIWLSLDLFGTIYLGNHYLLDGLVAIPLTVIAIFSANLLIKAEEKYYRPNAAEEEFVEKTRKWLFEPFAELKYKLSK